MRLRFICLFISIFALSASAQVTEVADTIAIADSIAGKLPFYRKGLIGKVYDYFEKSNVEHEEKRFDIGFIGGPHYSSEAGFGIGAAASAKYRSTFVGDTLTPFSNITLKVDVTTGQLYKISGNGYHILKHDHFRFNYEGYYYSFKDSWWGIGYENDRNDANECKYKRFQALVKGDFVYHLTQGMYVGPSMSFTYVKASKFSIPQLLEGQQERLFSTSIGATFRYDTRDIPTAASHGVNLILDYSLFPKFLGNASHNFNALLLSISAYQKVWRGGILAERFSTRLTWGHTPWNMLSTFGGSSSMRGYWEGRYRDKCESDISVELRQKVWRRHGIVLFAETGTVYPRLSAFTMRHLLPCVGVGYRWEFKKGVNVRLDCGFGRDGKSFNFSLNEAF